MKNPKNIKIKKKINIELNINFKNIINKLTNFVAVVGASYRQSPSLNGEHS